MNCFVKDEYELPLTFSSGNIALINVVVVIERFHFKVAARLISQS